ncbi:thiamine ABC transporter ATP-binding protein [Profundibacter sp.]|uniref:thiamine ABC transporter ATP-binding protein n=1 Tax=Profundibacter sp. TaxID=3101071 RepID=UPI003D09F176
MLTFEDMRYTQGAFSLHADFTVRNGEMLAVIGPSGGGKSTLLNVVAGFLEPTSGRVLWDGQDLAGTMPGKRPVSILFQDNNLFPHMTVTQNVGLGLRPDLRLSVQQKTQVEAALARVGLDGYGARKPAALSGGQASRVALARMLLRGNPLVLLDEPFAALGPALKVEMLDLVRELMGETGATLMMVSHDPGDAKRIAQRTVLVAGGEARAPVETGLLFSDPPEALQRYLG